VAQVCGFIGLAQPLAWAQSSAETFPTKVIKIVVPQPAGGGFDFVARVLSEKMAQRLSTGVVVENRTGSGTLVGTDFAAKSPPDGYTLLLGSVSNMVLNAGMYKNLSYDPVKDFEPLGLAVGYSYTLVARKDAPQKTLAQWIDYAKANPGKVTFASAGSGSGQHVIAAALWHLAGVTLTHVPYRGAQAAYTDLIGSRVDLFFDLSPTARVHVDSGELIALAVSGPQRLGNLPNVPTLKETGVANLELESWFGLFAPSKTPVKELQSLRAMVLEAMQSSDVKERFERQGGRVLALGAEESRVVFKRDLARWVPLIRSLSIEPE
jgi:tripartite-type tricarboxylate transporter receptor subunit TctC